MDLFSRDDLRELLADRQILRVSVFMRTTRGTGHEDKIRWKNQLREAEERLVASGCRRPDATHLLAPGAQLLDDVPFWQEVSEGLAGFFSPTLARWFRVPFAFDEQVVVGNRFHLKPVIPLFWGNGQFYLLAITDRTVRLFRGTDRTIQDLDLHSVGKGGGPEAALRELAVNTDTTKDGLMRWFHRVDRALGPLLQHEQAPLLLAGTGDVVEVYRKANTYAGLLPESLDCDPDQLGPHDLHGRAWPLVQQHFRSVRERAIAQYHALAGTGQTAHDLAEVAAAAYRGQVQYLIAARDREQWGTFDPNTQKVTVHSEARPGDEDLVNFAVVHTLAHKGTVFAVDAGEVPDGAPAAAIFRLPIGERTSTRTVDVAVAGKGVESQHREL